LVEAGLNEAAAMRFEEALAAASDITTTQAPIMGEIVRSQVAAGLD
jgi:hypothetical protein